jgi:hypothetical protein
MPMPSIPGVPTATTTTAGGPQRPMPVIGQGPEITGTTMVGETLSCSDGSWVGADTIAKQWCSADIEGSSGFFPFGDGVFYDELDGETGDDLVLAAPQEGKFIFAAVTASNEVGETFVIAPEVGPVAGPL